LDFFDQIGHSHDDYTRRLLLVGGDGLTYEKTLQLKKYLQCHKNEFESFAFVRIGGRQPTVPSRDTMSNETGTTKCLTVVPRAGPATYIHSVHFPCIGTSTSHVQSWRHMHPQPHKYMPGPRTIYYYAARICTWSKFLPHSSPPWGCSYYLAYHPSRKFICS
jgi:hypothetical protein